VCNPGRRGNTPTLIDGIELDADSGEPLVAHIARHHPGDPIVSNQEWQARTFRGAATGRPNVLQIMRHLRPDQVRGVPWVAPILEPLKQINRYTDAELNSAVTNAIFSVFIKMDPNAFQDIFEDDARESIVKQATSWSGEMESGKAVNLLPGESIESATPGRPNAQFDPFLTSVLRQIGMALQLPYEVLVMHFQSSYSAARGALLMAWRTFRAWRDLLSTQLCQPVYELWLSKEVAEGRIRAPGFFNDPITRAAWCSAQWIGDGPGSIDPAKEVAAAASRVDLGISTLDAESILHDGIPWADKERQRAIEVQTQTANGTLPAARIAATQPVTSSAGRTNGSGGDEDESQDEEE
jgi:lambda family phage portal protein